MVSRKHQPAPEAVHQALRKTKLARALEILKVYLRKSSRGEKVTEAEVRTFMEAGTLVARDWPSAAALGGWVIQHCLEQYSAQLASAIDAASAAQPKSKE